MQNNNREPVKINPLIIAALALQTLFVIFAVISFRNVLKADDPQPAVKIDDYHEVAKSAELEGTLGKIPAENQDILEQAIYQIAERNSSGGVKSVGAKIREGSVSNLYFDDIGMYYINFLVDLADSNQSYRVVYRALDHVPNDDEDVDLVNVPLVTIFCPRERDLLNGDFSCQDDFDGLGEQDVVSYMLGQKRFNNFTVGIPDDFTLDPHSVLLLNTISDDEAVKQAAIDEISAYLTSLGFNPDDYEYDVGASVCCEL